MPASFFFFPAARGTRRGRRCAFYWLWAWKNRAMGPIKKDMGVLTFGFGAVAYGLLVFKQSLRVGPLS